MTNTSGCPARRHPERYYKDVIMKIKREVKIGFFTLGAVLALYWGVNFLKGRDIFHRSNTYYATYDQVNGLQPSSAIMIKGFKVGVIRSMSYDPGKSGKIILEFDIKSRFRIPDNSNARIFSDGLMGGKAVEIELGNSPVYLEDGDTLRSAWDKDFLELAGNEFEFFKQKAKVVVDELMRTLGDVNTILEQNSANINTTLSNLASMSTTLDKVISSESDELQAIIGNLNKLSRTLSDKSGSIENIVSNVEGFTDSLNRSDLPGAIGELRSGLAELNTTLKKLNAGEGTAGKLLSDDNLYDSLSSAASNLSRLLDDIQKNPKRYVHFSLFGGGKK